MPRYEIILRLMSNANPIRKVRGAYFSRVSPIALLSSSKLSRSSSLRSRQIHGGRIQPYLTERLLEVAQERDDNPISTLPSPKCSVNALSFLSHAMNFSLPP